MSPLRGAYQLIKLEVDCFGVAVLGVLDEKHHQKRQNCCCGIDNQLPCVAELKNGPCNYPCKYEHHCTNKNDGPACNSGRALCYC